MMTMTTMTPRHPVGSIFYSTSSTNAATVKRTKIDLYRKYGHMMIVKSGYPIQGIRSYYC